MSTTKLTSIRVTGAAAFGLALAAASPAQATLTTYQTFNGNVGLSSDGCGTLGSSCPVTVTVPAGSTVLSATLYTGTLNASAGSVTGVLSAGSASTNVSYTPLPANISDPSLQAGRTDVTGFVSSVIGSGGGPTTFRISESNTAGQDGEALFVVFRNSALPDQTVALLDGSAASSGDTTSINFASPLNPSAPGFTAELRIADSFSFDQDSVSNQVSTVTVDGGVLSNNVGDCDDGLKIDGSCANGNLITVGGDNDPLQSPSTAAAFDPADIAATHERFDFAPLITPNTTSVTINTINSSQDDNIFALASIVTGDAGFNAPPPVTNPPPVTTVPEPAAVSLFGAAVLAAAVRRRR